MPPRALRYLLLFTGALGYVTSLAQSPQVRTSEFVYDQAPFPSCHASTVVELAPGRIRAAWFGGTRESHPDVTIWTALREAGRWSVPVEVATGVQAGGRRYPCWNPVLFQTRAGLLFLFYKVGPNPRAWWGEVKRSTDGGTTWSAAERLPEGFLGPVKNKPIQLPGGDLLCPSSTESVDEKVWAIHLERCDADGRNWRKIPIDRGTFGVIQPSILTYPDGRMQLLCRSRQNAVVETWSTDGGETWGPLRATSLPNPNSGTDAVTLKNGMQVLVYNPLNGGKSGWGSRAVLRVAVSKNGSDWRDVHTLEGGPTGEFSYPALVQGTDGTVHLTYTHDRKRIRYVQMRW
jgi:alpha-L-fucosidase